MSNNAFVVVLEGNPGAGKTTLKNGLMFDDTTVERVDQIIPGNPGSDEELVLADIIASDLLKSSKIQKAKNKIIIMDRYIHSTLAYQYAYDRLNGTSDYDKLHTVYRSLRNTGCLVESDLTVYIDVPPELSVSRKGRSDNESNWTNKDFLNYMRSYYKGCSAVNYTIDGTLDYQVIYNELVNSIEKGIRGYAKK